ncbi:hypothetical protein ACFFWD_27615 [Bradyrhizobium erythrophlei]|uniref:hypothetical protein n=1 Tax=Bradyrhizobium erythrophlei TaxID=1437360 RepID=UPI0035E79195
MKRPDPGRDSGALAQAGCFLSCCVLGIGEGVMRTGIVESIRQLGRDRNSDVGPVKRAAARALGPSSRVAGIGAVFSLAALAGCSIHPLVDDVSPIPTEAIVAAARCELRLGLVHQVEVWFADEEPSVTGFDPNTIGEPENLKLMKKRFPKIDLEGDWQQYMDIAIAYEWSFDITETNHADASVGFRLPTLNPAGTFDLNAGGNANATRQAKRTFKNQDKFGGLLTQKWWKICNDVDRSIEHFPNTPTDRPPFQPQPVRPVYPITGTIGLARAVTTFLKIAVQEGALDTFTDELTFTTTFDGRVGGAVTLAPVPKEFRLVNATTNLAGSRLDIHKVKISMAFPKARVTQKTEKQKVDELLKDVIGGYELNAQWRAAYTLCVVDARSREDDFKNLRLDPPEVTCLASTDAFYPRGNGRTNSLLYGRRFDRIEERVKLEQQKQEKTRLDGQGPGESR